MRKLLLTVAFIFAFILATKPVLAAKPAETGFNEYGYNYGARLFNGWYGQWAAKSASDPWDGTTLNAYLIMKWSKDWTPQEDEPVGAWVTNHWTWYSNDYEESTWYGFTNTEPWTDKNVAPDADYRIEEFMKIQSVGDNREAWLEYEAGRAYSAGWGAYDDSGVPRYVVFQDVVNVFGKSWNLDGNWNLDFNSTLYPLGNPYTHTLAVTGNSAAGTSTGNTYNATVSITGKDVTIVATYLIGSGAYPYSYTAIGTISSAGTLSGTWTGSDGDSGTWSSTLGTANYSWVSVAEYNIATTSPKGLGKPIF